MENVQDNCNLQKPLKTTLVNKVPAFNSNSNVEIMKRVKSVKVEKEEEKKFSLNHNNDLAIIDNVVKKKSKKRAIRSRRNKTKKIKTLKFSLTNKEKKTNKFLSDKKILKLNNNANSGAVKYHTDKKLYLKSFSFNADDQSQNIYTPKFGNKGLDF